MIDTLRKRMILICCTAVTVVFALIFGIIYIAGTHMVNSTMDMMADRISEGNGVFRPFDQDNPKPPGMNQFPDFFTEETPFSTRFFTVWITEDGEVSGINLESVFSVTETDAYEYAEKAIASETERGWQGNYRFKVFDSPRGTGIVFVDGSMNRSTTRTLLIIATAVLVSCLVAIFVAIVVVSKRAVRPIAQSYEKQRQFVTDANHELKTPLTLILTNLDIVEQELGHSEWLDDIRSEGMRMSRLVEQLTALSRLDEDAVPMDKTTFSLSEICQDTIAEFSPLLEGRGLTITAQIQPYVLFYGDEGAIRRLITILMDNAVKYCDPTGDIFLSLTAKRQTRLVVENSYSGIDGLELNRLFDRFYRADKARTAGSSFGIGLSLARSITEKHDGTIKAYPASAGRIGFRVTLK